MLSRDRDHIIFRPLVAANRPGACELSMATLLAGALDQRGYVCEETICWQIWDEERIELKDKRFFSHRRILRHRVGSGSSNAVFRLCSNQRV